MFAFVVRELFFSVVLGVSGEFVLVFVVEEWFWGFCSCGICGGCV